MKLWPRRGRRAAREQELNREIEWHLNEIAEEHEANGLSPIQAVHAARRDFGNDALVREDTRQVWGWLWLSRVAQDGRYALRLLARSPGFTAVAVLSLALGIGANTAILSVMDAFLLRPLPVRDPQYLVVFDPVYVGRSNNGLLPYPMYERLRTLDRFFSNMTAVLPVDRWNVTIPGQGGVDPAQCSVGVVTGSFFETLGVQAAIGRTFGPEDDTGVGGHPVAVVSYSYWDRKFGRDADILGRTFTLNATTYTVIGVTPRGFTGEWVGRPTDFWVPVAMLSQVMTELPPDPKRGGRMAYHVVARLRPGVERGQAQAAAHAVHQQYIHENSPPNPVMRDDSQLMHLAMVSATRGFSPQRQLLTQPLVIVSMMVGLVLLIACVNLANLLLARSAARRREITVRLAVGAGRARIVRQLLTESVVLAGMGGIMGLLFAWGMGNTLLNFAGSGPVRRVDAAVQLKLHPDTRVLLFTLVLCLATGILFGLAPAIRASKVSISPGLGERGPGGSAGGKFGKALIVLQVALSVLLLIGAGLFVRTLRSLKSQDLGIDRAHVLVAWIAPGQTGRWGAATAQLYSAIEQRLSAVPGVAAVSPNVYGMFQGSTNPGTILNVPGYIPASDADTRAPWSIIGTRFFDALGLSLVAGRNLTDLDTVSSPQVAIINQSMARHFFGNDNPLGRRFESWGVVKEIVGVVKDAKYEPPREEGQRMFYLPYRQQLGRLTQNVSVAIRTYGNPEHLESTIRWALREVDPRLPVLRIETVEDQLDALLVPERATAAFSLFFGVLAALLASIGLYGVMAYNTARRTGEIGLRLALGASRQGVVGMVLKETLSLAACGVLLGVPAALAGGQMVSARLFGVRAMDPLTITAACILMIGVAALAGLLPAWRAAKVDPMAALRHE